MIDMHNHMLPRLDDGAADWQESLDMAQLAVDDGITDVVCTPHWWPGVYENSRLVILESVRLFKTKLQEQKIPLKIHPGCELRLDPSIPAKIKSKEILTLNDNARYVLIELPDVIMPENLERFLSRLSSGGITPVIGHPERNPFVQMHPTKLATWVELGALVQVTAGSLLGHFGKPTQALTLKLIEHEMVHVVATDAHGMRYRRPQLSIARQAIGQLLGEERARQMTYETPKLILRGSTVSLEPCRPISKGSSMWKKIFFFWG